MRPNAFIDLDKSAIKPSTKAQIVNQYNGPLHYKHV